MATKVAPDARPFFPKKKRDSLENIFGPGVTKAYIKEIENRIRTGKDVSMDEKQLLRMVAITQVSMGMHGVLDEDADSSDPDPSGEAREDPDYSESRY